MKSILLFVIYMSLSLSMAGQTGGAVSNKKYTVNGESFVMVDVQGGTFTMGAIDDCDYDVFDNEMPAHQVTLSSYSIGQTEVNQALWTAVMGDNPSHFKYRELPVENVSWDDCQMFISKLNSLTGLQFRLPTEAEWEYAARGGKKSKGYRHSGSDNLNLVAWYDDNSDLKSHSVGTKFGNELTICDMSGNVWEWCQDYYANYSSDAQSNPKGPANGSKRVIRGGCWINTARYCRVSHRLDANPDFADYNVGFRLALDQIENEIAKNEDDESEIIMFDEGVTELEKAFVRISKLDDFQLVEEKEGQEMFEGLGKVRGLISPNSYKRNEVLGILNNIPPSLLHSERVSQNNKIRRCYVEVSAEGVAYMLYINIGNGGNDLLVGLHRGEPVEKYQKFAESMK